MAPAWFPEGTTQTTLTTGGRRRVNYTLPDGAEAIEEYDLQTDELLVRKRRAKTTLGAFSEWTFEVGEAPARVTIEGDMMRVSSSNPVLVRKDRPHAFEWRIRNLPYPKPTYELTIDDEKQQIVVRTANKKYFKRIDLEDMQRARLPLEAAALEWAHENSTLIIQYKKPAPVLAMERDAKVARLSTPDEPPKPEGAEEQCKQQ